MEDHFMDRIFTKDVQVEAAAPSITASDVLPAKPSQAVFNPQAAEVKPVVTNGAVSFPPIAGYDGTRGQSSPVQRADDLVGPANDNSPRLRPGGAVKPGTFDHSGDILFYPPNWQPGMGLITLTSEGLVIRPPSPSDDVLW